MKKVNSFNIYSMLIVTVAIFFTACNDDDNITCTPDTSLQQTTEEVTQIAANHYKAYTDIIIDASPEKVWDVLTDWDNMPSWSTSLQGISGDVTNGGQVQVTYLNQGQTFDIPHTLIFVEGERFGWSDPTVPPFDGFVDNHLFIVEKISDCQSRFIQSDEFNGEGNATFNAEGAANFVLPLYTAFNAELKMEVERN